MLPRCRLLGAIVQLPDRDGEHGDECVGFAEQPVSTGPFAQVLRDGDSQPVLRLAALSKRDRCPGPLIAATRCRLRLLQVRADRAPGVEELIRKPTRRSWPYGDLVAKVEELAAELERPFAPLGLVRHARTMARQSSV